MVAALISFPIYLFVIPAALSRRDTQFRINIAEEVSVLDQPSKEPELHKVVDLDAIPKAEFDMYKSLPTQWAQTKVYRPSVRMTHMLSALLAEKVPGLGNLTFNDAFKELDRVGCPVWIIGGAVRDLVRHNLPNDLDIALVCDRTPDPLDSLPEGPLSDMLVRNGEYFSLGATTAVNGLEGISIGMDFSDAYFVDFTANFLFYSVVGNVIIDPSSQGLSDVSSSILRPVVPAGAPETVKEWQTWLVGGMVHQSKQLRYAKFRSRGWKPYSACFASFMGWKLYQDLEYQRSGKDQYLTHDHFRAVWLGKAGDTVKFTAFLKGWWAGIAEDLDTKCPDNKARLQSMSNDAGQGKLASFLLEPCATVKNPVKWGASQGDCEVCAALRHIVPGGSAVPADTCMEQRIRGRNKLAHELDEFDDKMNKFRDGLGESSEAFEKLLGLAREIAHKTSEAMESRRANALANSKCQQTAAMMMTKRVSHAVDVIAADGAKASLIEVQQLGGKLSARHLEPIHIPDIWTLPGVEKLPYAAANWYGKVSSTILRQSQAYERIHEEATEMEQALADCTESIAEG